MRALRTKKVRDGEVVRKKTKRKMWGKNITKMINSLEVRTRAEGTYK